MNPFPKPEEVDKEINEEIKAYIQNQLSTNGKIMFYDVMEHLEKAVEARNIKKSKVIAWYVTESLLKSRMPDNEQDFLIIGMKDQIDALEENREAEKYSE